MKFRRYSKLIIFLIIATIYISSAAYRFIDTNISFTSGIGGSLRFIYYDLLGYRSIDQTQFFLIFNVIVLIIYFFLLFIILIGIVKSKEKKDKISRKIKYKWSISYIIFLVSIFITAFLPFGNELNLRVFSLAYFVGYFYGWLITATLSLNFIFKERHDINNILDILEDVNNRNLDLSFSNIHSKQLRNVCKVYYANYISEDEFQNILIKYINKKTISKEIYQK